MSRRILSVLFVLALALIVADAKAQDFSKCTSLEQNTAALCPTVPAAMAGMQGSIDMQCEGKFSCPYAITQEASCTAIDRGTTSHDCIVRYQYKTDSNSQITSASISRRVWKAGCPNGEQWNPVTGICQAACSSQPPMLNVRFQLTAAGETTCSGGCSYAVDLQGGSGPSGRVTIGGVAFYRAASMSPTGDTCTVGNQPAANDGEACTQQGNLTQCVKEDGRHCTTASTGKEFCWQPGENGIKASGNDAATKSPDGTTPKPPPLPPNNGGEWTQTGQSTVVTDVNGQTQTSNVTGWQSNYGGQGQGATGGGASGEGNSGSGSGSGLGGGNGNGDGEGEDEDGPGGPGAGVGDLYTPTDKTIASVFNAFKARVSDSPIVDSIDSFFTVNATGGCPVFSVPGNEYWEAMSFDAHCSGDILQILERIGWVLMAVAAFLAAIWALS